MISKAQRLAACLTGCFFYCLPALVLGGGIQTLDTVEVVGKKDDLIGAADSANQGTVLRKQIENRPILRPGELMETVPGVIVTQHSGDGKANQYFLRGFNLDHGTDLFTTVAGMPINMPTHAHGHGYTDLNFLIPELVSRIQYRKGPYYAEEGDFSAAGAVHIDYLNTLNQNIAEVGVGSFGFRRGLLAHSSALQSGNLIYAIELFQNDGPWENPEDYRKINGVLRYSQGDIKNNFALTAMAYQSKWNSTDQIPQRAINGGLVNRFGAIDKSDGGETHRYSLSGEWLCRDNDAVTKANAYWIDYGLDLFSNFTFFLDDPINGDQFEQVDRRKVSGFNITRSQFGKIGNFDTEHSFGIQVRHDQIGKVALSSTRDRVVLSTTRDDQVKQTSTGLYYQNLLTWNDKLRTLAGVRADFYNFDVASDIAANSGNRNAHIVSPKLSFIFGPWNKTEYYLNFGRGFHSNDARGTTITVDPKTGTAANQVTPLVRATGKEIGVRSAAIPNVQTSLSLWQLDIASELLFVGDAGVTEPSRPSRRTGIEWANYWTPINKLTIDADFSLSRSRFTSSDSAGDYIPGAIEKTVSIGITIDESGPWSAGLRLRYFGPRPLIEDNSVRSSSSTLINANVGYKIKKDLKLGFEVFNLTNRKVSDIEYFYESQLASEPASVADRHVHPAEPRSIRAMLTYKF
jgi:outer membrane receptor protein involved in Fe transport